MQNYNVFYDANKCRQTGFYDIYWRYEHTNLPTNGDNGTLVVFRNGPSPGALRVLQIYMSHDQKSIFMRSTEKLTDDGWTSWQRIATTDMLIQKVDNTTQNGYI